MSRLAPILVLIVLALGGCAEPGGNRADCEWLILQAYPAVTDAHRLDLHVWGTNCGDEPVKIEGSPCMPHMSAHPTTRIGNETMLLGFGPAAPPGEIPCPAWMPATPVEPRPVEPGQPAGMHGAWDGTIRVGDNETRPAPPGEYVIEVRLFGRLDLTPVTLHENRTFSGGKL